MSVKILYFVGRHSYNELRMGVTLSEQSYTRIIDALGDLNLLEGSQLPYLLFSLQYQGFKQRWKEAEQKMVDHAAFHHSNQTRLYLEFNLAVSEVLFGFRQFLDNTDYKLSEHFGENSLLRGSFKLYCAHLYDTSFSYRFCYYLRNYAQHRFLPIDRMSASVDDPKSGVISRRVIAISRDTLLQWKGWKASFRKEIENGDDVIPLLGHIDTLSGHVLSLYGLLINYYRYRHWRNILFLNKVLEDLPEGEGVACVGYLRSHGTADARLRELPEGFIRNLKDLKAGETIRNDA